MQSGLDEVIKSHFKVAGKLCKLESKTELCTNLVNDIQDQNKQVLAKLEIMYGVIKSNLIALQSTDNKSIKARLIEEIQVGERDIDILTFQVKQLLAKVENTKLSAIETQIFNECLNILLASINYFAIVLRQINTEHRHLLDEITEIRKRIKKMPTLKDLLLSELRNINDPTNDGRGMEMGLGREPLILPRNYTGALHKLYRPNERDVETQEVKNSSGKDEKKEEVTRSGKLKSIDDRRALDGRGIALTPKHQIEKHDPHHRGWRTLFNEELVLAYKKWNKLTVSESRNLFIWANKNKISSRDGNVVYMNENERFSLLASTNEDGKLTYNHQSRNNIIPDSKERENDYIYVMDLKGNFFIAQEGPNQEIFAGRGRIQHPSFTSGDRILCGGKLKIKDGKVSYIDNDSGHYLPGGHSLSRLVDELEKRAVLSRDVQLYVKGDERFEHLTSRKKPTLTLDEFRSVLRVWPRSPLAKLDLSEKPNPDAVNKQMCLIC